MYTPVYPIRLD